MASLIFNSFWDDLVRGKFNFETDTVKAMLVTSAYAPDKDAHLKRNQVTNEVANGNGYTTGGQTVAVTITKDTANDRLDLSIADPSWASASFTARAAVLYKSRGGAATADELIAYADFGADTTATNGTFTADFTTPLRIQN